MIPYRPDLKEKARELRKGMTPAERRLWYEGLKLRGEPWYRQKPLLDYIVDFYCPSWGLVVELDGDSHLSRESEGYDDRRDHALSQVGLRTLRFTNGEVENDLEFVLGRIDAACRKG